MRALNTSPAQAATIGPNAPVRMISPARNALPRCASVSANHKAASSGLPRQAAPAPTETGSPARSSTMPQPSRSTSFNSTGRLPSTNRPQEALSAMVSASEISQPAMRLSTTSRAGSR
ncbi:hypothetical protein D3C76_1533000 [compost metagenome]